MGTATGWPSASHEAPTADHRTDPQVIPVSVATGMMPRLSSWMEWVLWMKRASRDWWRSIVSRISSGGHYGCARPMRVVRGRSGLSQRRERHTRRGRSLTSHAMHPCPGRSTQLPRDTTPHPRPLEPTPSTPRLALHLLQLCGQCRGEVVRTRAASTPDAPRRASDFSCRRILLMDVTPGPGRRSGS
jgi:hypothetical protein